MDRNDRTKRTAIGRSVSEPPAAIGRRTFLARSAGVVGAAAAGINAMVAQAAEEALPALPKWMRLPGTPMRGYGQPSKFEEPVKRFVAQPVPADVTLAMFANAQTVRAEKGTFDSATGATFAVVESPSN